MNSQSVNTWGRVHPTWTYRTVVAMFSRACTQRCLHTTRLLLEIRQCMMCSMDDWRAATIHYWHSRFNQTHNQHILTPHTLDTKHPVAPIIINLLRNP